MNTTFEALFQMLGEDLKPPHTFVESTPASSSSTTQPTPVRNSEEPSRHQQPLGTKRGTSVTLPPDFLRIPCPQSHSTASTDYLTLFSDPTFLAEMEREFGPNFETILREHMQAEALRNTSHYTTYNDGYSGGVQQHNAEVGTRSPSVPSSGTTYSSQQNGSSVSALPPISNQNDISPRRMEGTLK